LSDLNNIYDHEKEADDFSQHPYLHVEADENDEVAQYFKATGLHSSTYRDATDCQSVAFRIDTLVDISTGDGTMSQVSPKGLVFTQYVNPDDMEVVHLRDTKSVCVHRRINRDFTAHRPDLVGDDTLDMILKNLVFLSTTTRNLLYTICTDVHNGWERFESFTPYTVQWARCFTVAQQVRFFDHLRNLAPFDLRTLSMLNFYTGPNFIKNKYDVMYETGDWSTHPARHIPHIAVFGYDPVQGSDAQELPNAQDELLCGDEEYVAITGVQELDFHDIDAMRQKDGNMLAEPAAVKNVIVCRRRDGKCFVVPLFHRDRRNVEREANLTDEIIAGVWQKLVWTKTGLNLQDASRTLYNHGNADIDMILANMTEGYWGEINSQASIEDGGWPQQHSQSNSGQGIFDEMTN